MILDIRSLFELSSILGLVLGSLFLVLSKLLPRTRVLRHCGLAVLCLCAANAAASTRNIAPDFVSIVLANALAHVAFILFYAGIQRLEPALRVKADRMGWLIVAADFPLLFWFTYHDPALATRIILVSLASAFLIGRVAWRVMVFSRSNGSLPSILLGALSGFAAFMMLFTAIATAVYGENSNDLLLAGPPMTVMFSVKPLLLLLIGTTVLWLEFQLLRVEKVAFADGVKATISSAREAIIAESEKAIAANPNGSLSVALLDLDNFKSLCKVHGREAGEELMKWVESICSDTARPTDITGRYSIDQIAVVMPHTSQASAAQIAEKLRRGIEQGACMFKGSAIRTTTSVGVTCLQPGRATWKDLANSAQVAIFRARSGGRNRVESAGDLSQKIDIAQL